MTMDRKSTSFLIRLFSINLYEIGTDISFLCLDADITELNISGMAYEESFGRQIVPHGRLRIVFLLLVFDGLLNLRQVAGADVSLVKDADARQTDIFNRVTWQSADATAHASRMAYLDVVEADAIDGAYMVDGYQRVEIFSSKQIASGAIAQTDEDGGLSTLDADI